jgi:hypothetical protein
MDARSEYSDRLLQQYRSACNPQLIGEYKLLVIVGHDEYIPGCRHPRPAAAGYWYHPTRSSRRRRLCVRFGNAIPKTPMKRYRVCVCSLQVPRAGQQPARGKWTTAVPTEGHSRDLPDMDQRLDVTEAQDKNRKAPRPSGGRALDGIPKSFASGVSVSSSRLMRDARPPRDLRKWSVATDDAR